jgi:hypothetical protein
MNKKNPYKEKGHGVRCIPLTVSKYQRPKRLEPRSWTHGMNKGTRWMPFVIDNGGDEGDRTPDLMNAIHALSQLSYVPVFSTPPATKVANCEL